MTFLGRLEVPARRAAAALAAAVLLTAPALPEDLYRQAVTTPSGRTLEVVFRSLRPGDPVLVVLKGGAGKAGSSVEFRGRRVAFAPLPGGGDALAFIGLDLALEPGSYPLTISIRNASGPPEIVRRDIVVGEKTFPSTKLTMKKEYVTPPPSVRERIRRESELVSSILAGISPGWLGDGPFERPHPAPVWPNFGQRRLVNNVLNSVHSGIDVRVPAGEPIRSANAGRVVLASDLYLSGKTVIIDHGLGVFSSYGHMSKLLVKRGDRVPKGRVLGLCGSTGRSTGPHLHWAMRVLGSRVDPEAMLLFPVTGSGPRGKSRAS